VGTEAEVIAWIEAARFRLEQDKRFGPMFFFEATAA